jgi:DNA-directed RNA polymerase specialized sigma subunit
MEQQDIFKNWQIEKMSVNGREIPYDVNGLMFLLPSAKPDNEIQALLESAPGQTIEVSNEEIQALRNVVVYCIDILSEQDRFIVEAINYEQLTYDQLGRRMGISNVHAWRLKQTAYKNLMNLLLEHSLIKEYLGESDDE